MKRKEKEGSRFGYDTFKAEGSNDVHTPPGGASPPSDSYYCAYLILLVHGVGHLLPWNFFITAREYFENKFACAHSNQSGCASFIVVDFENFFSVSAMLPIVVMTAVNVWLQSRIHYKHRLLVSLVSLVILFGITVGFVYINTSSWIIGFFSITLMTIVVMNVFSAIFQSSTFGFAGVLPPKYTASIMSGQAFAGIAAALALIVTKAVASKDHRLSALLYFLIGLLVVIVCLISFYILLRLPFVRHSLEQTSVRVQARESAVHSTDRTTGSSFPLLKIFFEIKVYALSVFLVFAVTLSIFPAVLSRIKSSAPNPLNSPWTNQYFNPLVCFLTFNCSDFVGRFITNWIQIGSHRYVLLATALLRSLFIPLFLFCYFGKSSVPVVFNNDAYPIMFVMVFGFSNGYIGSMAMIAAPRCIAPDMRETASTVMSLFLSAGLFVGSLCSFVWTKSVLKLG